MHRRPSRQTSIIDKLKSPADAKPRKLSGNFTADNRQLRATATWSPTVAPIAHRFPAAAAAAVRSLPEFD